MLYRKMTIRSLRLGMVLCVGLAAAAAASACGGDDGSGSKQQGVDGGSTGGNGGGSTGGNGGATGGVAGTGGGGGGVTGGTGGGGAGGTGGTPTAPAPMQDPTTGDWICTDPVTLTTHPCACDDGLDNDMDQTIDSADPNCAAGPYTDTEEGTTGGCGTTQCTNCVDDDGDGEVDSADLECTGALDNAEDSFATGIPGDNSDACKQDCFFDGNSGAGDDHCNWDLRCDPLSPGENAEKPCPYDPDYNNCTDMQTQSCIDYCQGYTPNGCDCFGCCTVQDADGVNHDVKLAPTCSADLLDDPVACPTCTKTSACDNPCELCEYCLGKAPTDPSCFPSTPDAGPVPDAAPPASQCDVGVTPCIPGDAAGCSAGFYCLTGCCVPILR